MAGTGKRQVGTPAKPRAGRSGAEAGRQVRAENGLVRPGAGNGRSREVSTVPVRVRQPVASTSGPGVAGGHMIDLEFLRGLIGAVDESGIDSIEITRAGTRIRISKTPPATAPGTLPATLSAAALTPAQLPALPDGGAVRSAGPQAAAPAAEEETSPGTELFEVKSPMVGTYYRAPAPEAPPYVEVGSHVTRGQTLCILEAMKLMNELESEVDGIVREVLVDNAEPVEFGQVLYRIDVK